MVPHLAFIWPYGPYKALMGLIWPLMAYGPRMAPLWTLMLNKKDDGIFFNEEIQIVLLILPVLNEKSKGFSV